MKKSMEEFIKEQVEQEDKLLLEHVKKDSATCDIQISKETDDKVLSKLRIYAQSKEQEEQKEFRERYERQQEELARLRRQNRRSIRITRYAIVAAALVLILAVGMTSIGGADKVFETLVQTLQGGGTEIEIDNTDGSLEKVEIVDENVAYEQMKELWGVDVVRLQYLPDGVYFDSAEVTESLQLGKLVYKKKDEMKITYHMLLGYQTSTNAMEIEDGLIKDYEQTYHDITFIIKEYDTEKGNRWLITFSTSNVRYMLMILDENQECVEKILKNLIFY